LVVLFGVAGFMGGYFFRNYWPEKGALGRIKIRSTPSGATIFLDGRNVGKSTPATLKNIKPGKHKVKLAKEGFVEWKAAVSVVRGKEALVEAILVKAVAEEEREEEVTTPEEDTTSPPTPTQLSPPDGQVFRRDGAIMVPPATLEWSEVTDPSGVTYSVEVEFFMFTQWNPMLKVEGLNSMSLVIALKTESQRWRVWAVDGAGNQSEKSPWWSMRIYPD
jgi:hypothetical protein